MLRLSRSSRGALTNRAYQHQCRPWDLRRFESRDVTDGMGANIRIDTYKRRIMRIIPRPNDYSNFEWLTDRSRFISDVTKHQRIDVPMVRLGNRSRLYLDVLATVLPAAYALALKYGDAFPIEKIVFGIAAAAAASRRFFFYVDWETALDIFNNVLQHNQHGSIVGAAGSFIDMKTTRALKGILRSFGSSLYHGSARTLPAAVVRRCADDRALYTSHQGMHTEDRKVLASQGFLLLFCNMRYESPLLNISVQSSNQVLAFGYQDQSYTNNYVRLGTSPAAFLRFLEGKIPFNLSPKVTTLHVLAGPQFYSMFGEQAVDLLALLKEQLSARVSTTISMLHRDCSTAGLLEEGFVPHWSEDPSNTDVVHEKPHVEFAVGVHADTHPSSAAFSVIHTSHGDRIRTMNSSVVLPAPTPWERSGYYMNTFGHGVPTCAGLAPEYYVKEELNLQQRLAVHLNVTNFGLQDSGPYPSPMPYGTLVLPAIKSTALKEGSTVANPRDRVGYLHKANYYSEHFYAKSSSLLKTFKRTYATAFDRHQ